MKLVAITAAIWLLFYSSWESGEIRLVGAVMLISAIWPMIGWVQRNDDAYPLAETLLVMTVPFYVVPLILDHNTLLRYNQDTLTRSILCVLVFQLAVIVGSRLVSRRSRRSRKFWADALVPDHKLHYMGIAVVLNSIWLFASFTNTIPPELVGALRAIFFGVGLIGAFSLARLWGQSLLRGPLKALLVSNIFIQIALLSSSLLLIQGITLLGATILGYFAASRKIPWVLAAVSLIVLTILHNGKSSMRRMYWEEGRPPPTVSELPDFYSEWMTIGITIVDEDQHEAALLLFDRASLLQIVAYVVDRVPRGQPFLNGATYRGIPAQLVPRFFWPDKPSPNESVKMLSVGLGLLSAKQAESTSIGFGMIAEAYANFGLWGAGILGLTFGFFMQTMAVLTMDSKTFSLLGLLRILLLAWCLSAEVTLVIWLSSLYQACIAISVPTIVWSKLNGGGTPNAPPTVAMESHSE